MPDTLAPESWRAPPIQSPELEAHYAEIRSFQAERADRATRRAQLGWASFIASMLVNILLAGALVMLMPLQRLIPMPLIVESDGTWDAAATFSSLPPSQEEAVIRGAVWQYVKWRESYSWSAAQYAYDFVSLMSVPPVRDQYEHWFLPINKHSPQLTIGRKGQVDVAMISMNRINTNVYLVRFRKTIQMYGRRAEETTWSATVEVGISNNLNQNARLLDPGGIKVVRYSSTQDTPNS
jgi:type IV secretion system protein VirB8